MEVVKFSGVLQLKLYFTKPKSTLPYFKKREGKTKI